MSVTHTVIVGKGVKVYREPSDRFFTPYDEEVLDESKYPELMIAYSGHGVNYEHWVFMKETVSKIYTGYSGNGHTVDLPEPKEPSETAVAQMKEWLAEHHQDDDEAKMAAVLFVN